MLEFKSCSPDRLRELMGEEVILFRFIKNDGTVRDAYGTLSAKVIEDYSPSAPSEKKKTHGPGVIPFFDIEKLAWRCFRRDALLGYCPDYVL